MNERGRRYGEENYADGNREDYSSYEETYRDGSLKNECWNTDPGHQRFSLEPDPEETADRD